MPTKYKFAELKTLQFTPDEQLELAGMHTFVREGLANNPFLTYNAQVKIASNQRGFYARAALARNKIIHPDVQYILSLDGWGWVLSSIARNATDIKAQEQLVCDCFSHIRCHIDLASNTNLDPKIQIILAKSKNKYVRKTLNSNKNITAEVSILLDKIALLE